MTHEYIAPRAADKKSLAAEYFIFISVAAAIRITVFIMRFMKKSMSIYTFRTASHP